MYDKSHILVKQTTLILWYKIEDLVYQTLVSYNLGHNKQNIYIHTWFHGAGCKERHFYSLPFGQAEANIY